MDIPSKSEQRFPGTGAEYNFTCAPATDRARRDIMQQVALISITLKTKPPCANARWIFSNIYKRTSIPAQAMALLRQIVCFILFTYFVAGLPSHKSHELSRPIGQANEKRLPILPRASRDPACPEGYLCGQDTCSAEVKCPDGTVCINLEGTVRDAQLEIFLETIQFTPLNEVETNWCVDCVCSTRSSVVCNQSWQFWGRKLLY